MYGNQASVLVGDFLFSRAFQLMTQDGSIEVLRILSDASATIAEGEVLQLSVAGQLDTPLDTYIQVITGKTAALFAAATEVGPVIAGAGAEQQSAMRDFGMNLGIAFQIADDLLDYTNAIGDDFREGKVTAAIFYALERATPEERDFWHRTMQDRQQKDGDFDTALEILKSRGALVAAQDLAMRYAEEARGALDKAPDNEIKPLLHDLINFMVHRSF
ncbi:MAG TPA: polyprenyl synthetase family protein [Alphaproteobacteria bacterium]|nr:polyprenyl synthetase family protein [Alphaproteobacteria bacterium]